jgi:alpha-galactosidase
MLCPTPPMGWNHWNTFGNDIHEEVIRASAEALVETGLREAGYVYCCIDDCWEAPERTSEGRLTWDTERFPAGIPALADHVHSLGLKFGIYSCSGTHTCAGLPASFGHEEDDAAGFAEWGVDYLKYDHCFMPPGISGRTVYARMGQALRQTGREIVYSLCNWGFEDVWTWGRAVGGQLWRTTGDIRDSWESIKVIGFDKQKPLAGWAGPGGWNDPDMLVVGMSGVGHASRTGGCTAAEYRSHFGLWCLLAAPLIIGCDVRKVDAESLALMKNPRLLAINQDPLGVQGRYLDTHREVEVWAKPLADGAVAVGFFNMGQKDRDKTAVAWESLGIDSRRVCSVTDCLSGEDLGRYRAAFNAGQLGEHDCQVVRITPLAR